MTVGGTQNVTGLKYFQEDLHVLADMVPALLTLTHNDLFLFVDAFAYGIHIPLCIISSSGLVLIPPFILFHLGAGPGGDASGGWCGFATTVSQLHRAKRRYGHC